MSFTLYVCHAFFKSYSCYRIRAAIELSKNDAVRLYISHPPIIAIRFATRFRPAIASQHNSCIGQHALNYQSTTVQYTTHLDKFERFQGARHLRFDLRFDELVGKLFRVLGDIRPQLL